MPNTSSPVTAEMTKGPSFDYACAQTENKGIYGYDLVTKLGSDLTCTEQTATLADRGLITIVRQNIVFALGVKFLVLALSAVGLANMWMAIFADVGVMILAVLNAIRALFVKNL